MKAIHRVINPPLFPQVQEIETNMIKRIVKINGLDIDIRHLIRRRKLQKLLGDKRLSEHAIPDRVKWIHLPYLGHLTEKLVSHLC